MLVLFNSEKRLLFDQLETIAMKLSEAVTLLEEIKANLAEASTEILAKLNAYEENIDTDPVAAAALLEEVRVMAQGLADIVPDATAQ